MSAKILIAEFGNRVCLPVDLAFEPNESLKASEPENMLSDP